MTRRIYIGADRVTVSKPGYDAVNPPAVDYRYLALDSRLNSGRPLEIGIAANIQFGSIIPFSTTYPGIPGVDLVFFSTSGALFSYSRGVVMRDFNQATAYNRTPYYLAVWPNQLQIIDDMVYNRASIIQTPHSAFYVLWQNW